MRSAGVGLADESAGGAGLALTIVRIVFGVLGLIAFIATMLAASDASVRSIFLLIILSLGTAMIWSVPDMIAAFLPEKYIDAREAQRRMDGDMRRIYRLLGEIACLVLLAIGVILYRNGLRF